MSYYSFFLFTLDRRQSNKLILLTSIDQKSLETEFLIAICRQFGDKCQSKTLFLAIFYLHLSIVKSVFDCRLSGVLFSTLTLPYFLSYFSSHTNTKILSFT